MTYSTTNTNANTLQDYLLKPSTREKQRYLTPGKKASKVLKAFYKVSRLLHIYISMVLFGLLAFFCLTGIFLNHPEWFSKSYADRSVPIVVNARLQAAIAKTQTLANAPVAELQALLAEQFNLTHLNQMNFDDETGELAFDYQLPAGYATAYFSTDGDASLEYRKGSIVTIMNDLHKGRHSGPVWSWVIDISSGFMLLFSVAGLIILIQNKRHRKVGLVLGALGIAMPFIIYGMTVPFISGV